MADRGDVPDQGRADFADDDVCTFSFVKDQQGFLQHAGAVDRYGLEEWLIETPERLDKKTLEVMFGTVAYPTLSVLFQHRLALQSLSKIMNPYIAWDRGNGKWADALYLIAF